jgi:hypothetical protein
VIFLYLKYSIDDSINSKQRNESLLLQQLRKQYTTATAVKPTTPSSPPMSLPVPKPMRRKPGRARIDCAYQVVPYAFTSDHSPIAHNTHSNTPNPRIEHGNQMEVNVTAYRASTVPYRTVPHTLFYVRIQHLCR